MASFSKDVSLRILKSTNRIDPSTVTTDWASNTYDIIMDGKLKSLKFDEPEPTKTKEYFIGSDSNDVQYSLTFIDEWSNGKLSGQMVIQPEADGSDLAMDDLFLTQYATGTGTATYRYGSEITPDADLLVVIGKSKGARFLFKGFKVNKLNAFDVPDKGVVLVDFEFESIDEGSVYKQTVQ